MITPITDSAFAASTILLNTCLAAGRTLFLLDLRPINQTKADPYTKNTESQEPFTPHALKACANP